MNDKKTRRPGLLTLVTGRTLMQLGALAAVSLALGITFNSANPIGIRFGPPATADAGPPASNRAALPAASGAGFALQPLPSIAGMVPQITWAEVKPMLEAREILLVDARPRVNFDQGHIPGAVNLPYSANPKFSSTPEDFAAFEQRYPKDTPIAVYCTSRTCQLSQIIAEKLVDELGYSKVWKMDEGYSEYVQAERSPGATYASGTGAAAGTSASLAPTGLELDLPKHTHSAGSISHISLPEALRLQASGHLVLVDARPKVNFDQGHIPGAVSLPYSANPKFSSTEADLAAFEERFPKDAAIAVYCTSRTCQLSQIIAETLADQMGYTNVRKVDGGYSEYLATFSGSSPSSLAPASTPVSATAADLTPVDAETASRNPSRTSWEAVKPLLESRSVLLVDVRQAPTYQLGHIPGAVNLPYTSQEAEYAAFLKKYPLDTPMVLYCTDVGCPLSRKMAELLVTRFGYRAVQHMTEGYAEWQREKVLARRMETK